jgi:hypothetical protein
MMRAVTPGRRDHVDTCLSDALVLIAQICSPQSAP